MPIAMPSEPLSLDALGLVHGTDKCSTSHNYLQFYETFLAHIRTREPMIILEMGVGNGQSLRMWAEYFPNALIYGFDINPSAKICETARITIIEGDQRNLAELESVAATCGPFDVVVDDAGHDPDAQILAFDTLIRHIRPGGYYILEDIGDHRVRQHLLGDAEVILAHSHNLLDSIAFFKDTCVAKVRNPNA